MTDSPNEARRVLILADESADWKVAGLRQLDRLALSLQEYASDRRERLRVSVLWSPETAPDTQWTPQDARLDALAFAPAEEFCAESNGHDLVLSTRLFVYRNSIPALAEAMPNVVAPHGCGSDCWRNYTSAVDSALQTRPAPTEQPWQYLSDAREIAACERRFLLRNGKSQDGIISRYLNRPVSRFISRWLLKLPLHPSTWSGLIFLLPLLAAWAFIHGTYIGFVVGCAIFQLYSILDGCDGEIARAKFLQTEFGRRLDSFCDLLGNVLLALSLGLGLARQASAQNGSGWLYLAEGMAAAALVLTSEGIVFARRSRSMSTTISAKFHAALYRRHHEMLERSGILVLGEKLVWWLVFLTKRDMALFAFLILAAVGWPQAILHLLVLVSGVNSALAGSAFLRQPARVLPQEAA